MEKYFWHYKDLINDTLKESFKKGNKPSTIIKKINSIVKNHENRFVLGSNEQIYKERLERLKKINRCYIWLKSGYYKNSTHEITISLKDIKRISAKGEYFYLYYSDIEVSIPEQDYRDLKFLINNE